MRADVLASEGQIVTSIIICRLELPTKFQTSMDRERAEKEGGRYANIHSEWTFSRRAGKLPALECTEDRSKSPRRTKNVLGGNRSQNASPTRGVTERSATSPQARAKSPPIPERGNRSNVSCFVRKALVSNRSNLSEVSDD